VNQRGSSSYQGLEVVDEHDPLSGLHWVRSQGLRGDSDNNGYQIITLIIKLCADCYIHVSKPVDCLGKNMETGSSRTKSDSSVNL